MEGITTKPVINRRSSAMQRSVEDLKQWDSARKDKQRQRALEIEQQQQDEVTGRPLLFTEKRESGRSNNIKSVASILRSYDETIGKFSKVGSNSNEGTSTDSPNKAFKERLYEYEVKKQLKRREMFEKQAAEAKAATIPQIDPNSAKMAATARMKAMALASYGYVDKPSTIAPTVQERLYQQGAEMQRSKEEALEQDLVAGTRDAKTGQKLFQVN